MSSNYPDSFYIYDGAKEALNQCNAYSEGGAFKVQPLINYQVFRGHVFSSRAVFEMETDEVLNIIVDYSGYTGDVLVFEPPVFGATAGPVIINIYQNCTYTGGTAQISYNRSNFHSSNTEVDIISGATSSDGTLFASLLVPATALGAAQHIGFRSGEALPLYINPETNNVRVEVINTNGDIHFSYSFDWFEFELNEL